MIDQKAIEYGVSRTLIIDLVSCETAGTFSPTIQSGYRYKNGEQELSFGLAQIHLPSWPEITREQAQDPEFAITFMASKLKEGKQGLWSCYNVISSK